MWVGVDSQHPHKAVV